jgi:hypothetical protein
LKNYLLIIIFSLTQLLVVGQENNNILRCEIKSSLFKVPLQDGTLSKWRPLGKFDESVLTTISFDFEKMKIVWDSKSRTNDPNFKSTIEVDEINKLIKDTTYQDFGFTSIMLKCTNEKKESVTYELIEFKLDNCYSLFLIDNSKEFKSKQELKIMH